MSAEQTDHQKHKEPLLRTRKPFVTFIILSYVIILTIGILFGWMLNDSINQFFHPTSASQSTPIQKHYPAFPVSTPPATPQPGLPYTSQTVFDTFRTADRHISAIIYSYGWSCCVTHQPEEKLIGWQESYGVQLEIATFATPAEAKTDASDLLKNSLGYSVSTRNLCLFFYDNSISKAILARYSAVLSKVCS